MDAYKNTLKQRIWCACCFVAAALVFGVLQTIHENAGESAGHAQSFLRGMTVGSFIGVAGVMVFYVVGYVRALRDDARLKKLYIEEHDERTKAIQTAIGGMGYNAMMVILVLAAAVAPVYSTVVAFTLWAVVALMALLKLVLNLYYSRKF